MNSEHFQQIADLVEFAIHANKQCQLRIEEPFGGHIVKDKGGLEAAIGAVFQTSFGSPLYPDPYSRGAALLYKILKAHPFHDGNKRTSFHVCLSYLRNSTISISPSSSQEAAEFVAQIADCSAPQEAALKIIRHQLLEWTV